MKYLILVIFTFTFLSQTSAQKDQWNPYIDYKTIIEDDHARTAGTIVNDIEVVVNVAEEEIKEEEYVKDSLRILLVKLMGLKKLDQKNLLYTDIQANYTYYSELLNEFKESTIDPGDYLYLEQTCSQITNDKLRNKYKLSIAGNIIFGLAFVILLLFVWNRQNTDLTKTQEVNLSSQELKVKNLILAGNTNKEIAAELFLSLSTVKTHISNLYKKLGVSSRAELKQ